MKFTGIVRRIDELGRIVVPIEMRRALDIGERETMEISVEGDGIVLRRAHVGCVFCDGNKDISTYGPEVKSAVKLVIPCLSAVGSTYSGSWQELVRAKIPNNRYSIFFFIMFSF